MDFSFLNIPSSIQEIQTSWSKTADIQLFIKRDDLIHSVISGNKFRKLKYNLLEAKKLGKTKILTFGGSYSNHIHATAYACREFGFESVGIIRGEEEKTWSKTLIDAQKWGMKLLFISRGEYRDKYNPLILNKLIEDLTEYYLIPEGGANDLGAKGCGEIIAELNTDFDFICTAAGTGTTAKGLIENTHPNTEIIVFSALKGDFLRDEISNSLIKKTKKWQLQTDYHFGGYAKTTPSLFDFMAEFEQETAIKLDQVYTAKMLFGLKDLVLKNVFLPNTKILCLHTGGLQGNV
jgi:1-aminocyclopropane-1-carboxylate deaminase